MRVIVIVSGGQVETLQASPLLRTLAAAGGDVTLACPADAVELARSMEGAGEVIALRSLGAHGDPFRWLADWGRLRRRRFDAALICSTTARARLLAYLAGIPRRAGPWRGLTSILLSDHVRDRGDNAAALWLRLAHLIGVSAERHAPRFDPGDEAVTTALGRLHSTGFADGRLLVALAPGRGFTPHRHDEATLWESERWAHLANQLAARHGAGIVFVGGPDDETTVETAAVDVSAPHANLAGELDLRATAALLGQCDLLVSGDSPLLHLAAAVGTATVGLYGPTDGRRRAPWGEHHRALQALPREGEPDRNPLHKPEPLMRRIRVEDVLAAIELGA